MAWTQTLQIQRLRAWYAAASGRERAMVLVLLLALLGYLADTLLFVPQQNRTRALEQQLAAQQASLGAVAAQIGQLRANRTDAALAAQRVQRDALRDDVAYAQTLVQVAHSERRVGALAKSLIAQTRGLTLRGLQTRPSQVFLKAKTVGGPKPAPGASAAGAPTVANTTPAATPAAPLGAASAPAGTVAAVSAAGITLPDLYMHSVDISVDGTYNDLVRFVRRLEAQDQPLFWPSLTLTVTGHPIINLRATINTLSVRPDAPLE